MLEMADRERQQVRRLSSVEIFEIDKEETIRKGQRGFICCCRPSLSLDIVQSRTRGETDGGGNRCRCGFSVTGLFTKISCTNDTIRVHELF